ncbi:MAG: hypothetical protein DMG21_12085 [Acidobacteria bacterium]|nr:MAG: hypothetical protein DMG21_12085 [Acidobacteriota bacterium]
MAAKKETKRVIASVELERPGAPKELHLKFRPPVPRVLRSAMVNGRPARIGGPHDDTAIITTGNTQRFDVVGLVA